MSNRPYAWAWIGIAIAGAVAALGRVYRHISPAPAVWNFLDETRAEKALLDAFEATKTKDLSYDRGTLLTAILTYSLEGWRTYDPE